jgi:tetratricopeptide (TPR) repeat protein
MWDEEAMTKHICYSFVAILALYLSAVPLLQGQGASAEDELTLGVQAYKKSRFQEATLHFKRAVELDSSCMRCRLYLATAYAQQYIPGGTSAENAEVGQQALEEFEKVLALNPKREEEISALKGVAALHFNMKNLDAAKQTDRKLAELNPNDPETFYSIAVIDWTQCYQPRMEERAKRNLKPSDAFIYSESCWELKAKNEPLAKDGIEMLTKALTLRPDYDDAMAYMNLLYRELADIQCGDRKSYDADVRKANEWVDMTMGVKKKKADRVDSGTRSQP